METSQSGNASEKVLTVLEALVMHRRLGGVAASTGLAKSTVHGILQTMVREDSAAVRDSGGSLPGPRLIGLA